MPPPPPQEAEVTLFRSFLPQLCKRSGTPDLVAIAKLMPNKPFLIEEKLDGERIQLHKRGREYFYCSRCGCQEGNVRPGKLISV